MTIRSFSFACAASAFLSVPPAHAFDMIPGRGILVEKLSVVSQSVSLHSAVGQEHHHTSTPSPYSATLLTYNNGALLGWQPVLTPSCQNGEGFTSVQVVYARKGANSGSFNCDPQTRGGASDQSVTKSSGRYTAKASIKDNIVTLSGQLTYTTVYSSRSEGISREYNNTETIRVIQRLRLRLGESSCEVLDYAESATSQALAKGTTQYGGRFTVKDTSWRTGDVTPETRCKYF